jgi:hypothetical protein
MNDEIPSIPTHLEGVTLLTALLNSSVEIGALGRKSETI